MGIISTQESMQNVLPPGFRFHPTDEELITHYLNKKIAFPTHFYSSLIAEIDLYKFDPYELPERASFGDDEWFFFTPRDRKYPNGARPNRATSSGYWKATRTDKPIVSSNGSQCIGVKKVLVFYQGHPRNGLKTNWIMYEYRVLDQTNPSSRLKGSMRLDDWVLCRIRQKGDTPKKFSQDTIGTVLSYCDDHNKVKQHDVLKRSNEQSHEYIPSDLEQEGYGQYVAATNANNQLIMQQYYPMRNNLTTMRRVVTVGTMEELLMSNRRLDQFNDFNPVDSEASHICN